MVCVMVAENVSVQFNVNFLPVTCSCSLSMMKATDQSSLSTILLLGTSSMCSSRSYGGVPQVARRNGVSSSLECSKTLSISVGKFLANRINISMKVTLLQPFL